MKRITVTYREPTPQEDAEREKRRIRFADGTTGTIMNRLDEQGRTIIDADNPTLTILRDVTDWSNVKVSIVLDSEGE